MKFAERISRISISGTMLVSEKTIQLRDQGIDVVDFGAGRTGFPDAGKHQAGRHSCYSIRFHAVYGNRGTRELRAAIAGRHARDFGSHYDVPECIVNAGGKHAIFNLCSALVDEGDDVIIPLRTGFRSAISRTMPVRGQYSCTPAKTKASA